MHLKRNIIISTLLLSIFGIVMIYSASSYSAELHTGDAFFYVKKQIIGFVAGLVTMCLGYLVKEEWLNKCKWVILALSMILLLVLFIPGVGQSSYGATRWINLGFITFQSSEIIFKSSIHFVYLHKLISTRDGEIRNNRHRKDQRLGAQGCGSGSEDKGYGCMFKDS